MDNDAIRFAIAIGMFFGSMLCFFIAFHPSGTTAAKNPDDVLKWLLGEYETTAAGTGGSSSAP